ncbi:sulfite exporter TauE/SafE family protein [Micromonospora sp. WMMC241]|uniref:sulfite exporter TauE/SafE family protein n=1 Tax=Micromonospora sp. WMMC241 TaxID=3015159 RepID=UPI0022B73757|nr:sulfite exporter TauE/SafE family protein [Micromonospora sp. WMMC241]MCZ7436678.1 sulfite exporter TauE/SafE family protein [Micromonospora sp. WMMC241]
MPTRAESARSGPGWWPWTAVVRFFSGSLANSGGLLLAPLCRVVLHLPIKRAPATSLAASAVLALPGTVTPWLLGHIDWPITLAYSVLAVPAAYLGARLAIRANPGWSAPAYGVVLVLLAVGLLLSGR